MRPVFLYAYFLNYQRLCYNVSMPKNTKSLSPLAGPGLRGCWGTTKRKGAHRFCAQKAIVWYGTEGYCYYHDPKRPKKFGEGYR